jgi:hypothetical protein
VKREPIDFHAVPQHQDKMHERLLNWARWCHGSPRVNVSAMFRLYRSREDGQALPEARTAIDTLDGHKVERGVTMLPTQHRMALQWFYVSPSTPIKACRVIACTPMELALYVDDGRQMLMNRGV